MTGNVWNHGILNDFPFSWECHHPNWRTHIFQRGRAQPPTSLHLTMSFGFAVWIMSTWQPFRHLGDGIRFNISSGRVSRLLDVLDTGIVCGYNMLQPKWYPAWNGIAWVTLADCLLKSWSKHRTVGCEWVRPHGLIFHCDGLWKEHIHRWTNLYFMGFS